MTSRRHGEIMITQNMHNGKLCRKCLRPIVNGEKVIVMREGGTSYDPKYSRYRHIECYVDAHGESMIDEKEEEERERVYQEAKNPF